MIFLKKLIKRIYDKYSRKTYAPHIPIYIKIPFPIFHVITSA